MIFRKKAAVALAAVALSALALAGCSGDTGAGGGGSGSSGGGTLTLGIVVPATTFKAADSRWANESPLMQAVYDSLLKAEPDGTIAANLATKWEYNDDNTVLTLTLRDDVKFEDGNTMTAADAAASLIAFRDGTSPNATNLVTLKDATATDDTTLEITLTEPNPSMLTYLTQNSGLVESSEADASTIETVPDGSGPYTLNADETVVGSSYVFDKKADYWNPDDVHYDKIVMNVYSDSTAQVNAIQGGQVNVATLVDNTAIPQIEGAGYTAVGSEQDWFGLLLVDREGTVNPAMKDVRVRQAINYALDREGLLKAIAGGYGTATTQIFPTFSPSYDAALDDVYPYDVDKAKDLMADAGYANGFTLDMPSTNVLPGVAFTLIAQQLADIGITVNYTDLPISDLFTDVLGAKYAATVFQLQQDPTDYQLAQFQIAADSTWNIFKVVDPTIEDYITQIQTGDEATAKKAGQELNKYLVDNAVFAPFYRPQNTKAVDANTTIEPQAGNAWPYLWSIKPKN
jgi:peptide/nickel transport system substrate-binding protein